MSMKQALWCQLTVLSLSFIFSLYPGCKASSGRSSEDECDIMVPGEQLGHAAPVAAGDDLCGPRRLRTHVAGEASYSFHT